MTKSQQMARVRSRDTQPELLMRRLLSSAGVHYRLHREDIPGRPDLYVGRLRLAIFVNGCFWHAHNCRRGHLPKTNADFWQKKIARNLARDRAVLDQLEKINVKALTLWTCEVGGFAPVCRRIANRYRRASRR
jgi:DNA mismatch endonuclease (patch repair protein)